MAAVVKVAMTHVLAPLWKPVLTVSALHFVSTFGILLFLLKNLDFRPDSPPPSHTEEILGAIFNVLMQPGVQLLRHLPHALEMPVMLGNSVLWGLLFALAFQQ